MKSRVAGGTVKQFANETTIIARKLAEAWLSAWLRPLNTFEEWNALWVEPWRRWLESVALPPAAWLPALVADSQARQPSSIGFFLPWLPRIDAEISPLGDHLDEDAVRVMLRAVLPPGMGGDWLRIDATVSRARGNAPWPLDEISRDALPDGTATTSPARTSQDGHRPRE
jgi:hypothetical protein